MNAPLTTTTTLDTSSYLVDGFLIPKSDYPEPDTRSIVHFWRDDIGSSAETVARTLLELAAHQISDPDGAWSANFCVFDELSRTYTFDVTPTALLTLLADGAKTEEDSHAGLAQAAA